MFYHLRILSLPHSNPLMMKIFSIVWFVLSTLSLASCTEQPHYTEALSPEQALSSFQLHDGFEMTLFAAEPHVLDPVCMAFDAQGNIFVVEMPDYPYKPAPGEGKGRIKLLVDSDDDGQIDQSVVFADQLSEATSILPWRDGLLVTAAPNILYLKDTDGDFKADQQEVLFSGFFENNSEAQITNLRYSVDNWIYAANHGQAGEVRSTRQPELPSLPMQGGDFRFRLDRGQFELTTGPGQFGLTIDDWGNRFMTQNTIHIRHAVMPKRYTNRHADAPTATSALNISDHDLEMFQQTPPPYWRAERTRRRQQQYDEQGLDRKEYAEDHFSGASGGTVYTGDAFPSDYYGNIFTGDVSGNLVHRDVLTPLDDSPTFVASRHASESDSEFLTSNDPWFRPVNFTVGPDGYLYVIDMYRQHIETPLSIPEDLKEAMNFLNGSQRGRIYRIGPAQAASGKNTTARLASREPKELVALLAHPNQWWRLQAQRLLLDQQDQSVIPSVESLFSTHEDPRARLHALYVLEGFDALNVALVKQAMADDHPGVREHGVLLAERFPSCLPQLLKCVEDSSARVAFQASLSVGEFSDREEVVAALAKVAEQHADDPWFRAAVLSSKAGSSAEMLQKLSESTSFFQHTEPGKLSLIEDASHIIGTQDNTQDIESHLSWLANLGEAWQGVAVGGLLKGLEKNEDPTVKALVQASANQDTQSTIESLKNHYSRVSLR